MIIQKKKEEEAEIEGEEQKERRKDKALPTGFPGKQIQMEISM